MTIPGRKIGIFGANGFLGTYLVQTLLSRKIKPSVFRGDALSASDVKQYFSSEQPDTIVFLIGRYRGLFQELFKVNVETLQNVLTEAALHKVSKIIYVSSGAVYGESEKTGMMETDLMSPRTLYGLFKVYAEASLTYYRNVNKTITVILRMPNVYGGVKSQAVIDKYMHEIRDKKRILIFGDGNQRRDFLHIADAINAIILSLDYDKPEIFNISSSDYFSLNDIVKMLHKNLKFTVTYSPPETQITTNLHLDYSKAVKLLGYIQKRKIIDYLK